MKIKYLLLSLPAFIFSLVILSALFTKNNLYLELLVSLLPYLLVISIVLVFILAFFSLKKRILNPFLPSFFILILISSLLFNRLSGFSYSGFQSNGAESNLKIAFFNKLYSNTNYTSINQKITEINPDLIGLSELTKEDSTKIDPLKNYPCVHQKDARDHSMIAVYSKFPCQLDPSAPNLPHLLSVDMEISGATYKVLVIHPMPPINDDWFQGRNAELKLIANYINSLEDENILLFGDFNLSPWSQTFSELTQSLKGLKNVSQGSGLHFTWHKGIILSQVDHIFVPVNTPVISFNSEGVSGSDHNLIWTEIKI